MTKKSKKTDGLPFTNFGHTFRVMENLLDSELLTSPAILQRAIERQQLDEKNDALLPSCQYFTIKEIERHIASLQVEEMLLDFILHALKAKERKRKRLVKQAAKNEASQPVSRKQTAKQAAREREAKAAMAHLWKNALDQTI